MLYDIYFLYLNIKDAVWDYVYGFCADTYCYNIIMTDEFCWLHGGPETLIKNLKIKKLMYLQKYLLKFKTNPSNSLLLKSQKMFCLDCKNNYIIINRSMNIKSKLCRCFNEFKQF